ncbi:hypothetical protein [Alistipes sp.]|uniref:hypothetical protein n=1 Tax=Alistipes sp. TaxID=1872444 RepID=UPI0025BBE2F7|nr:hypothetical protein [Alistipes sp.]
MKKTIVMMATLMLTAGGMVYAQQPEKEDTPQTENPTAPEQKPDPTAPEQEPATPEQEPTAPEETPDPMKPEQLPAEPESEPAEEKSEPMMVEKGASLENLLGEVVR